MKWTSPNHRNVVNDYFMLYCIVWCWLIWNTFCLVSFSTFSRVIDKLPFWKALLLIRSPLQTSCTLNDNNKNLNISCPFSMSACLTASQWPDHTPWPLADKWGVFRVVIMFCVCKGHAEGNIFNILFILVFEFDSWVTLFERVIHMVRQSM